MKAKSVLAVVAALGIVGGVSGCSGGQDYESPKELYKAVDQSIGCNDPEFVSGEDDESGVRYGMFYCSDGATEGYIFKGDDTFDSDFLTAVENRDNKSTMENDYIVKGDSWLVWLDGSGGKDRPQQLQKDIGGELQAPEDD